MPPPIPLVDVSAQVADVADEVRAGWDAVLASGTFVLGPQLAAFEAELAAATGAADAVGVGNGTDALELAVRAAGVGAGDEVVLPASTFVATAGAVARVGARPRFVDVDPDTLLIDVDQATAALAAGARAVVPVHLHGQLAPMGALLAAAAPHGAVVVEDAAQSHGATQHGKAAGAFGVLAATSFYPSKNLGAHGDAGAVLAPSAEVAARLRSLRNHGLDPPGAGDDDALGWNSRLDELQAVVLRAKLHRLEAWNACRAEAARRYDERLADLDGVRLPVTASGNVHAWHLYAVRVPRRDAVLAHLRAAGIGAGVHYARPLHLEPAHARWGDGPGSLPVAEQAAAELLSLPLHPHLTVDQQDRVVDALTAALHTTGAR